MTESKPSYNTLEENPEEVVVDYESETATSSIYYHPPDTPTARDTTHVAPDAFVDREEVPLPLALRAAFDPTLSVLHNTLG
uniref:Uncharacterized protein n=1 Tax=Peronospora matthiolae TaxID=2874970 RepID=A0AAV1T129_9STRA